MLVIVLTGDPRIRSSHVDAELFVKLALESVQRGFAGFDLAARKFPVACIRLALRALRQQKAAVGALEHGGGDFDALHFPPSPSSLTRCLPAQ